MSDQGDLAIVALQGDQTGQELLDEALRVIDPSLTGLPVALISFDLSLQSRRATANAVVSDAAAAICEHRYAIKAATITPEGADDVGSPNRLLREDLDGTVIVRTGRRLPGVPTVAGAHHPISVVRMAVGDVYGAHESRTGTGLEETASRTERISRAICREVAETAFRQARAMGGRVFGGPKWTVSPIYEGMLKEEMDQAAERHPDVAYEPLLIDALYAALMHGSGDQPLIIPALNRDGDCLSDLVMPMFGSIAGAESVLVGSDSQRRPVYMAEAPHGTAPALEGKDVANPTAMILALAALLEYAHADGHQAAGPVARAIREATLETIASGCKTGDLGGDAKTSEFVNAVVAGIDAKLQAWQALGSV